VAKDVAVIGVKVLSNDGSGANSGILAGIEWTLLDALSKPDRPAVANLSLGGIQSIALNFACSILIGVGNVFMAVAAGNANVNACLVSPASGVLTMTVGATDINDVRSTFSNRGACVDIFGESLTSCFLLSVTRR